MKEYDLYDKVNNSFLYVELRRGIYGLKESGILANLLLKKSLSRFGYRPVKFTHGLWKHDTPPISFTLVVDDFGVKYIDKKDAEHLEAALSNHYPMKSDWTG